MSPRPLVLLPPSKGKADGGDGPAFGTTVPGDHPLGAARRTLLDTLVEAAIGLDHAQLARLCGVGVAKAGEQRDHLVDLATAPTLPAHQRYTGIVHGNAGLGELDPTTAGADVRIVSALLGLVALDESVPAYRLEVNGSLPGLGGLGTWWREHLADHLRDLGAERAVWDLLPGEHRRLISSEVCNAWSRRHEVRFVRPDGRPANAARTKVAKGRLAAHLVAHPHDELDEVAARADLGEGWRLATDGADLVATFTD